MNRIAIHISKIVVLAGLIACSLYPVAHAQQPDDPFIRLTVALIYRSSTFFTWPEASFESSDSPFIIGVLGNETLYDEMVKATEGLNINGHKIEVESIDALDEAKGMHVLYVAQEHVAAFLAQDQASRDAESTLTVSDSSKFVKDGGILRIFQKNKKPKLEVNVDAAKRQRLKISSQLLKNADVIRDTN